MIQFLIIATAWIIVGIAGQKLLFRKGYTFDGLDAIKEYQRETGGPLARAGDRPSGIVALGGPITLVVALLIRPREKHYTG
jgi:hypothetical protein